MADSRAAAAAALPDRIAFLGLGLIGGSAALALRDAGYHGHISAWTPNGTGPAEAERRGVIDAAAAGPEDALAGAGLVILAGPPLAILDVLDALAGPMRRSIAHGAVITDVASTKVRIAERAASLGLPFAGGHPMAGRETTGMAAATADLFEGRPWVVVKDPAYGAPWRTAVDLARAAGATPFDMPADVHDAAVAAISHLPLVLSAALVESVTAPGAPGPWAAARALAASGWRDMSRLAKGDPEMGAGILATNAEAVRDRLVALRATLDRWLADLDRAEPDPDAMRSRLEAARAALEPGSRP